MDIMLSVRSYLNNFPTALGFALLLIFILPFAWLSNAYVSSGTVLIGYGFLKSAWLESILLLAVSLAFLFFYSILVCLMVLAVRRDLSSVRTHYYLSEKIQKFAMKYFQLLAVITVGTAILASVLVSLGMPSVVINLILFVLLSSFIFLPQTIVVDEEGLGSSILTNWEFISKHPLTFLGVTVFGIMLVFLLELLEFALDNVFFGGNYIALLIALIVLVPFIEVVKTMVYMKRFNIIASYEFK